MKGLSQQSFADLFGLTRGNISSYEESRAEPKIEIVIQIAKYFGIPLSDFVEKDLSVNELLHYNTKLVIETEKLKIIQQLIQIPYVQVLNLSIFIQEYSNPDYIQQLPAIVVPSNSKWKMIAIEIENHENLPAGYNYKNGDVLIFEKVVKENMHRLTDKLGMLISPDGLKFGVYHLSKGKLSLNLNEWVSYPFEIDTDIEYWTLKATYQMTL